MSISWAADPAMHAFGHFFDCCSGGCRIVGEHDHCVHRRVHGRGIPTHRFAGSDERSAAAACQLEMAPGVPFVGVPGGDSLHAWAAGSDENGQRVLSWFGITRGVDELIHRTVEGGAVV